MQAFGNMSALFAGLVHPRARSPLERLRHQDFIASKLAFVALALAGAPIFIAVRGVPTPAEAAIFALAIAQLLAALVVARRGRIAFGETLGAIGLAAIGLAACWSPLMSPLCVAAWFFAAVTEATIAGGRRSVILLLLAGTAAAAACVPASSHAWDAVAACFAVAAIVPTLLAAWRGRRLAAAAVVVARRAEARAAIVAEIGDDAVFDLDPAGLVVHACAEAAARLGLGPDAAQGRGLFEHVQVADRPMFLKLVSDAAHGSGRHRAVLRLRRDTADAHDTSTPHYIRVEMRAMGDAARGAVVATLRDVSDAQDAAAAGVEARLLVAEAIRSRDAFLANVSHELRTPLNAVIGFSEMLASQTLRPADAQKQREYARIIHQSGQHLLSVVSAILDMSKIQAGTFSLSPEAFDVAQLVGQCHEMMQLKADAGRVALSTEVAAGIGMLRGDRRACKQILLNLLSNAVKFTPDGGTVTIAARLEGTGLRLIVSDTGIGVAAADLGKLGQPFFQVNGSLCRSFEGTGLGLSVVRGLVALHGGTLDIASEPGRGTTATVLLPLDGPVIASDALAEPPATTAPRASADVARFPDRRNGIDSRMKRSA